MRRSQQPFTFLQILSVRYFGIYGTPAPPPPPDPNLKLGATGTLKPPPSPLFKHNASIPSSDPQAAAPIPPTLTGTIVVWSSVDRKGIIETSDPITGKAKWFRILSPRAFETLVPPHVRDLTGATVSSFRPIEATDGSHEPVRIYNKLVRPVFVQPTPLVPHKDLLAKAERSMQRRAHQVDVSASIDRLEAIAFEKGVVQTKDEAGALIDEIKRKGERVTQTHEDENSSTEDHAIPSNTDSLDIATQIVVDLNTANTPKGKALIELKARDYFEGGMRPSPGVKDLRNKAVFSLEELALIKARQEANQATSSSTSTVSTEALTAERLKELKQDEADVLAYHRETGDLSGLGVRRIIPQKGLTFKFGKDANDWQAPSTTTTTSSSAHQPAGNTIVRTIHSTKVIGKVVAWSALHRSGLLVLYDETKSEAENKIIEDSLSTSLANAFIIRNVDAFVSAMPTAVALNGRKVQFTSVSYSDEPNSATRYAEEIIILGAPIDYRLSDPDARKTQKDKEKEAQRLKAAKKNYIVESVTRPKEAPIGKVYGVVTRWSGGQGAIEASNGVMYYINNPKAFTNVADTSQSSAMRGAVVCFRVNPESPEYATEVEILSHSPSRSTLGSDVDIKTVVADKSDYKPVQVATNEIAASPMNAVDAKLKIGQASKNTPSQASDDANPRMTVMCSGDIAQDDPRWLTGFIVTLSTLEGQGVIQSLAKKHENIEVKDERGIRRLRAHQLGERYLLKDFGSNVVNYNGANRVMIKKGRKVRFIPYGSSGRMATLVTPTDLALTEEEVKELENSEKERGEELQRTLSASEEALPGPTSGMYWMERLEHAGFDMTEMRELKGDGSKALDPSANAQKRAQNMGLDEEDLRSDSFDPIALMENDPWYKDKSKNIKIPGSDMRLGDVQKLSPSSMMGLATKVKDPASLQKTKDKYYNRLTEPQKEWAWNQAKEQAPLYEKRIKEARLKGEEPKFTFF